MSFGSFTMWGMLAVMAFGVVLTFYFEGNPVGAYRDVYPADVARQEALRRCGDMDPQFSRFSQSDRDRCYHTFFTASSQNWSSDSKAW